MIRSKIRRLFEKPALKPEPANKLNLRRYPELDGKTLLLGIGAMKCGTSWWNRYLDTYPNVICTPLKEVHFFDSLFQPDPAAETTNPRILARLNDHLNRDGDVVKNLTKRPHFQSTVDRVKMIYDHNEYFGHFARLVMPEHQFISETTPAYAILPLEGMRYVKDLCSTQDIALKVVFLMRDPVDRMWSHLRFMKQRNAALNLERDWREWLDNPRVIERADYKHTIQNADRVFGRREVKYAFYEDLSDPAYLKEFAASLGLKHTEANHLSAVNETSVKMEMTPTIEEVLSDILKPQYTFCKGYFGEKLTKKWRKV